MTIEDTYANMTIGELIAEFKKLKRCLAPIIDCEKATFLASLHGCEYGDDEQFDALYNAVWKSQTRIEKYGITKDE